MPVATPEQYRAMIDAAQGSGFAYPAVNVSSSQTLNAALLGLTHAQSDGIVQVTPSAAGYLSGPGNDMAAGARAFADFARVVAVNTPVLIGLHTDHCTPADVDRFLRPLLDESRRRVSRRDTPLFNSHMFDGSELPLAENLALSAHLLRQASELGIVLEVEIGTVGGEEDGLNNNRVPPDRLYTTPADALAVAETLGNGQLGRYLLAATFGNVHGHYAPGKVLLRPELLGELQSAFASRFSGSRFDFVFHGGSGSTVEDIRLAVANGVVKVNIDTDTQYAFSHAVEVHFGELLKDASLSHAGVDKGVYDPRSWGRKAERAMATHVIEAAEILGSAGRTLG